MPAESILLPLTVRRFMSRRERYFLGVISRASLQARIACAHRQGLPVLKNILRRHVVIISADVTPKAPLASSSRGLLIDEAFISSTHALRVSTFNIYNDTRKGPPRTFAAIHMMPTPSAPSTRQPPRHITHFVILGAQRPKFFPILAAANLHISIALLDVAL